MNPFVRTNQRKEVATVTPADIIYHRRVRVIERAAEVGVARAGREAGVSRTSYYRRCGRAERYGLSALLVGVENSDRLPTSHSRGAAAAALTGVRALRRARREGKEPARRLETLE